MAKKSFKCSKCHRSFGMAAHLARHMNSTHASPKKKAAAKRKRAAKKKGGVRKVKARRGKRVGSKAGLRSMSVEALSQLIADARGEVRRRVADLQKAIK